MVRTPDSQSGNRGSTPRSGTLDGLSGFGIVIPDRGPGQALIFYF